MRASGPSSDATAMMLERNAGKEERPLLSVSTLPDGLFPFPFPGVVERDGNAVGNEANQSSIRGLGPLRWQAA